MAANRPRSISPDEIAMRTLEASAAAIRVELPHAIAAAIAAQASHSLELFLPHCPRTGCIFPVEPGNAGVCAYHIKQGSFCTLH